MSNPINSDLNSFFLPPLPKGESMSQFKIDGERSILSGKIGRTWTGFFRDWLATFGLISDSQLKGLSFFQRWSNLSTRSFTLKSLNKGYVESAFFVEKIKQKNSSFLSDLDQFIEQVDPFKINSQSKISDLIETDKLQMRKWIQATQVRGKLTNELNKRPEEIDFQEISNQIQHLISIKRAYETAETILRPMIMHLHTTQPDLQSYQSLPASKTEVLQNSVWFSMSAAKSALAEELNECPENINFKDCKILMRKFEESIKDYEELKKLRSAYACKGLNRFRNILKGKVEEKKRQPIVEAATGEIGRSTDGLPLNNIFEKPIEGSSEEGKRELSPEERNEKGRQMRLRSEAQLNGPSSSRPISDSTSKSPPVSFLAGLKTTEAEEGEGETNGSQQQRLKKVSKNPSNERPASEHKESQKPLSMIDEMKLKQQERGLKEGKLTEARKKELDQTMGKMKAAEELLKDGDEAFRVASEVRALRIEESIRKHKEELNRIKAEKMFNQEVLRKGMQVLRVHTRPESDNDEEWNP